MITTEEKKQYIKQVDEYMAEGMTQVEACEKAGISLSAIYRWRKSPVDGRSRRFKNKEEPSNQVVIYKPEAKEKPAPRTVKQAPQMTLVMGTPEQIAELLRSR